MNHLAKLRWIGNHGFSIGIDDVQPGKLSSMIQSRISEGYAETDKLIQSFREGKLTPMAGCDAVKTLEVKITDTLNQIRDAAGNVCMKELHWRNRPLIMSQCGSKGSPSNISQMVACVGQQAVGGCRAPDGFIDRSLLHFPKNSKTPAVKTADTGYMSHRLMKCLEDLAVHYDLTVRDSSGTVVQFIYGDDAMDPGQMGGAEGFPLDFDRLQLKVEV